MKRLPFLLSVLLSLIGSSVAQAGAPLSFTYQGLLKEDGALVNGPREMTATIYDDQNDIVSQQVKTVNVESGSYAMTIDNIDLAKVVAADHLYLGIKVGDDGELSPRLLVTSMPYALAARYADTAGSIKCDGCISASQLDFIASDDFTLPSCPTNQVMVARGNGWVCSENLEIEDHGSEVVSYLNGKVAINTGKKFLSGLFEYYRDGEAFVGIEPELSRCPCSSAENIKGFSCNERFTSDEDWGEQCFDQWGGSIQLYKRNSWLTSLDDVVVVDGSSIGIGTGRPEAPVHLRTTKGYNQYEMIIADLEPEILLEDIDGVDFAISIKHGQLVVSRGDKDDTMVDQVAIGDNQVTVTGAINAASLTVDRLTVNSGSISNSMIASAAAIDAKKLDLATLKALVLEMSYPVNSIKITTDNVNPGTYLGGTWVAWGSGRVPVGVNTNDGDFATAEKTGGEKTHTLTSNEMPSHTHIQNSHNHPQIEHTHTANEIKGSFSFTDNNETGMYVRVRGVDGTVFKAKYEDAVLVNSMNQPSAQYVPSVIEFKATPQIIGSTATNVAQTATNQYTGGGAAHNNLQPYITCYMWKRTK